MRIATNPFGEWLLERGPNALDIIGTRLSLLNTLLQENEIQFCSLGPAETVDEISLACAKIVRASPIFSCSANIDSVESAQRAAQCMLELSKTTAGGLGNFRFCAAGTCKPFIPSFSSRKIATRKRWHNRVCSWSGKWSLGKIVATKMQND